MLERADTSAAIGLIMFAPPLYSTISFLNWLVRLKALTSPGRQSVLFATKPLHVLARLAGAQGARGEGVGNPHIEGQPALQFDLPIKQVNGFRSSQPQLCQNVLHLALEARLDARANRCGFSHGAIVALVWLHCQAGRCCPFPSRFTFHASRFTLHVSRFTFHASRFTFHASRFTFHVSRFTFHVSRFTSCCRGFNPRHRS